MNSIKPARRTENIKYAVRDIVLISDEARALGKDILPLNIGDPIKYDFSTPPHIIEAIYKGMKDGHTGYSDSAGIPEAIEAIRKEAIRKGIKNIQHIFTSTGGSEGIELAISALVNKGENILIPYPGYPLYSAVVHKFETDLNYYYLDEENEWAPDFEDIEKKITPKTKGIVIINPNNPTGAVYTKETLEKVLILAEKHNLVVFSDEIYDKLTFDGVEHISTASLTDEIPVITFNGLAKSYLGPGLRIGWAILSGKSELMNDYSKAIQKLTRARLCASHPAQFAIKPALEGSQVHIKDTMAKLERRRELFINFINNSPLLSCVEPKGAFYAFPKIHKECDDFEFVSSLIRHTGVVVVHGSGFGQRPGTSHFRIVLLPNEKILTKAFNLIDTHLNTYLK